MLDKIANKIQTYSGKPPVAELRKAAVLIAVTESDEPELIYTLRSNKVGTHGGEVSFPGGMYEKEDVDLENTALRETEEETGLDKDGWEDRDQGPEPRGAPTHGETGETRPPC